MGFVTLRSDGRWSITYEVACGVETTLATPAASRNEAARLLHHCELEAWTCRVTGVPIEPDPLPWSAIWAWWESACLMRYRSPQWRGTVCQIVRDYVLPTLGHLCAGEIKPASIEGIMARMVEQGRSPTLANKVRSIVKIIIHDAIANDRWPRLPNPADFTPPRRVHQVQRMTLTRTEFRRLLKSADPRHRTLWALSGYLGLRKGELFALRRGDIDTRRRTLAVVRSHDAPTTKTGASRLLPITRELWAILSAHLATLPHTPDALLFPATDGGLLRRDHKLARALRADLLVAGIVAGWESRCRCGRRQRLAEADGPKPKRAACLCGRLYRVVGIAPPVRAHDLRHTFTTLATAAGVHPEVIRMTLGHSGGMTSRYCHLDTEAQRRELTKLKILDPPKRKPDPSPPPEAPPDKVKKMAPESANPLRPNSVPTSPQTENQNDLTSCSRPSAWEADALPTELFPRNKRPNEQHDAL